MAYIGQAPTPLPLTASDIPDLPATKITSGTFPALNGSNLTSLPAGNLTGTLPAISGANLTGVSAGKINQVLTVTIGSEQSTTTGAYADVSGLSLAITPSATSSKILVQTLIHADCRNGSGNTTNGRIKLFRDSTELEQRNILQMNIGNGNPDKIAANTYHSYLDSPSSTSALTYKYQFSIDGGTMRIGASSKIVLLEVLA
tara:strand:+ start:50 stop:652 length:603 start_codon:yes stop_codon:yes gene_type:complete